jgi:hypothetical protein
MTAPDEVQGVLDRWYAAIRSADAEALAAAASPDVVVRWNGPPDRIPWAGEHPGVAAAGAFFRTIGMHLEVLSVVPVERVAEGDRVVIILAGRWRVRSNGRLVEARAANLFTLREGRVAGYEVFPDSAAFAAALAG